MNRPSLGTLAMVCALAIASSGCGQVADGSDSAAPRTGGLALTKEIEEPQPLNESAVEFVELPIGQAPTEEELEEIYAAIEELTARMEQERANAEREADGSSGSDSASGNSFSNASSGDFSMGDVTDLSEGSTSEFCAALNVARASHGRAAFDSCERSVSLTDHARDMAQAQDVWHSGNDNVVGFSGSLADLMQAFMDSPTHRELIVDDKKHAKVGCYWATSEVFRADGSEISPTTLIYCAGKFS